ncbi:hypothetical protein EYF80_023219 [Liparis tanakae]|uniref:Uncharacterized protein n=1 Tax=Liparis tanakae TaxID=230148 RepID=A0A4Z2HNH1_9TELE|nr:hypothetical protein EYF80_023219 [Liparis tanakae]
MTWSHLKAVKDALWQLKCIRARGGRVRSSVLGQVKSSKIKPRKSIMNPHRGYEPSTKTQFSNLRLNLVEII